MQIYVGEQRYRQDAGKGQPVNADLDARILGGVLATQFFELPVGVSRFEATDEARFHELMVRELGSLQIALFDAADFAAAWGGSRPGDELLALGNEGQAEFGFEALDGTPARSEYSKRVRDHDSVFVKLNVRVDENQPHRDVDDRQRAEQAWQFGPGAGKHRWNDGQKRNEPGSDCRVKADLRSNGSHDFHYPHQKASLKMHEEN